MGRTQEAQTLVSEMPGDAGHAFCQGLHLLLWAVSPHGRWKSWGSPAQQVGSALLPEASTWDGAGQKGRLSFIPVFTQLTNV